MARLRGSRQICSASLYAMARSRRMLIGRYACPAGRDTSLTKTSSRLGVMRRGGLAAI